jgi:ribosome modulation factor
MVRQDAESWAAGYKAGHSGQNTTTPPAGTKDSLAWISGAIEGKADRAAGIVRPLVRKPENA